MDHSIGNDKTFEFGSGDDGNGYALNPGDVLGQYRVVRQLGRGGMGQVYEVEHTTLGRRYALKLLPEEFTRSANALERFKREAKVMANLEHPNIIRVDEFGETEGRYWLRMELAEGVRLKSEIGNLKPEKCVTLADLAKSMGGKVPQEVLLPMLRQVLDGLRYAHEHGAVHRDLKPSNILLTTRSEAQIISGGNREQSERFKNTKGHEKETAASSGFSVVKNLNAKIADFGLVKLVGEEWIQSMVELSVQRSMSLGDEKTLDGDSQGTSTRSILGTYEYMSPEQKRGGLVDARTDLYAMGIMLYSMLTGRKPEGRWKLPSQLGCSAGWDAVVERCLEPEVHERFQNVDEMLAALPEIESRATAQRRGEDTTPYPTEVGTAVPSRPQMARSLSQQKGPQLRNVWTAELGGGVSMEFMPISAGSFQMGSTNGDSDEKPVHQVTLTKPFWLAKTEVTQAQWRQVMGSNPSDFKGDTLPVETVNWNQAMEFCRKLTERERQAGRLPAGFEYTLPTEAQWEYACRAGTTGDYAGNLDAMAWYDDNSGSKTHPVGTKKANAWGLFDMHGNVWEWCLDNCDYSAGVKTDTYRDGVVDPVCKTGSDRVLRGGSWYFNASYCRSALRNRGDPSGTRSYLGFRPLVLQK